MEFLNIIIDRVDSTNVFNVLRGRMPSRESHLHSMMDNDLIQEYLLEIERLSKIGTSLTGQERDGIFDLTGNLRRMGESFFLQFFPSAVQEMLRSAENGFLFLHTDEQLRQIPWELLHDGVCFLADKFYIGKNISGHWRDRQREERENLRVLIACDPTEDLEWARREGEGLFEALNSEVDPERLDIRFMSGRDITKLSLLDAMKDRDVVHYAGHVDPARTPGESGWPLSGGKILRTREIEKAGFSPDLVFANGCSVQRSLGESDVASAFLRAGIANFIGTNWEIRDSQNTLDFAVHFYRSIFEEKSLGESLFEARQFARRTYPPADLTWANYVLHGNPMARIYRSNRRFQIDMPALVERWIVEEFPAPIARPYSEFIAYKDANHAPGMLSALVHAFEEFVYLTGAIVFGSGQTVGFRAALPDFGVNAWLSWIHESLAQMSALRMEPALPGLAGVLSLSRENLEKLALWANLYREGKLVGDEAQYVVTFQYIFESILSEAGYLRRMLFLYIDPEGGSVLFQGTGPQPYRILPQDMEDAAVWVREHRGQIVFINSTRKIRFSLHAFYTLNAAGIPSRRMTI
ncbi:MAG: CHAT domain-containing protein [Leptospirales bacterium]|nr:CHAT domain-containing protein [Leptospirales bacterium]HMW59851.1 CHAT domain-containing protein [Leptospiraceae bacterium]